MNIKTKKALAMTIGAVFLTGAGMAVGANAFPKIVTTEKIVTQDKIVTVEVPVDKVVEKVVEKPIEVATYIDNGKLDEVIKAVFDNRGNVEFATDDLDDSEIVKLADRLVMANDFRSQAESIVKDEAFKELHKDSSTGVTLDKDDMRSLSLDYDSISFDFADFDKGDADLYVPVTFKQNGDKFEAMLLVQFDHGNFDSLDVESVTKL